MTRLEALCLAFGLQGETIHQMAEKTGCSVDDLLNAKSNENSTLHTEGWYAFRTCSLEHRLTKCFLQHIGHLQYWLGVADAVFCSEKLGDLELILEKARKGTL